MDVKRFCLMKHKQVEPHQHLMVFLQAAEDTEDLEKLVERLMEQMVLRQMVLQEAAVTQD